eukprot:TRINITY_DN2808_c0_g1_i3.p1 TRINITY_DN2808_c0_g1~~TRINITY_DN2808_c0_g1_i3.p1  ORF type:complete len:744 (+),score=377.86 TRINITY_DN2808_c0_g1_i3:49-2232(+)
MSSSSSAVAAVSFDLALLEGDLDLNEEHIASLEAGVAVVDQQIKEQGAAIKKLKDEKADRAVVLAEVKKLDELKAFKTKITNKLFPPQVLDVDREGLEELARRRFFFAPAFSIYGGFRGLFDLGPPGCAIKANLLNFWRQFFVLEENMLEIDTTSLTPDIVLQVSGHVEKFKDLMVKDVVTGVCHRADHLLEDFLEKLIDDPKEPEDKKVEYRSIKAKADAYEPEELGRIIKRFDIKAPETGNDVSDPFPFNLMFETKIGPTGNTFGFMRPETAQGIFCNFAKLLEYNGGKLPFAGATIGLAFRNEISPRNALLRVREFQLAEIEHFIFPDETDHPKFETVKDYQLQLYSIAKQEDGSGRCLRLTVGQAVEQGVIQNQTHAYFIARTQQFLLAIGIRRSGLRFRQHLLNEKAHYANDCWDAEILTSYGWVECVGLADRGCYDLTKHSEATGQRLAAFRDFPDGPKIVDVKTVKPNKGLMGKHFGKKGKYLFAFLDTISEDQINKIEAQFAASGQAEIAVTYKTESEKKDPSFVPQEVTETFVVKADMLTIASAKVKKMGEAILPRVIEPSFGIGRIIYAALEHAYLKRADDDKKKYFAFTPLLAPVKCSVLPLLSTAQFQAPTQRVVKLLNQANVSHKLDDVGKSIGRRYARTDEIGVPFGITIDHTTFEDDTVTVRDRDSTLQVRCPIAKVADLISNLSTGKITWAEVRANPEEFPPFDPVIEADD